MSKKPSDQIRIGVIGVSGRGGLARHSHNPDGHSIIVAGADPKPDLLNTFKETYEDKVFTTPDYRRLLERPDIDAVFVTSPDYLHEEHAIAALKAGKHVYLEKPMAITVEGCDRILKAEKETGKHLMVGFNMRYMNLFHVMKEIVDSGTIGEIRAVWVRHFVGHGGRWYFHDWHANRKTSTGLLLQKASHDFDMIHWITGQYTKKVSGFGSLDYYGGDKPNTLQCHNCPDKDTCPEEQAAWKYHDYCCFREEVDVEDNSVVAMELENGIKATYTQCHFTPDYWRNYVFIGTEGRMENLNDSTKVEVKMRGRLSHWKNGADRMYEVKQREGGHGGSDPDIVRDFIELIRTGKQPLSTPLAGRMSVATGVAATRSIRSGGRVVNIKAIPEWYG